MISGVFSAFFNIPFRFYVVENLVSTRLQYLQAIV